jgi:hypothetical protein
MVNWVTTYKKITTKNILSWENAWVQDLAQYYCFGMVKINRKADPKPMPQWVADHFWKSTNSFVGNMLPERYWSDYLEHFADDDPTTLKEDPTTEVMVSLYKGLVTSCYAGTKHNKGIPYNTSMTKSRAAWSDTVAVRGRACALAGLLVGLQSPSQKHETKSMWR